MKIGFIGLGKMGLNIASSMAIKGHEVFGYDINPKIKSSKIQIVSSVNNLLKSLPVPQIIWLMLPAGNSTKKTLNDLSELLHKDSIIIDAGNSHFLDTIRNFNNLKKIGIHLIDCGTSGGTVGAKKGQICMMIGGDKAVYKFLEPIFKDICTPEGYGYFGNSGSGHYVKMVHNGIEYGMMASIAEGFQALSKSKLNLDLQKISSVLKNGSIIESNLLNWLDCSLKDKKYFNKISGAVPKGETEDKMNQLSKIEDMRILKEAIRMRVKSRRETSNGGVI